MRAILESEALRQFSTPTHDASVGNLRRTSGISQRSDRLFCALKE